MQLLNIIYEDDILLVCNKPAGLMVEPDRNNFPNLLQEVKKYLRLKTVDSHPYAQHLHRLDRPVSGIVLFTKQKQYLKNLSEQFAERKVSKYYKAVTSNAPLDQINKQSPFVLEQWHRKEKKKAVLVPEGTEYAEKVKLEYVINEYNNYYLWDITLHTGKFHQIRVQLASLGCPILGDEMYGSADIYEPNAIALHAEKLIIYHPVTLVPIEFIAESNFKI